MSITETILWVFMGILMSLILPIAVNTLRRATTRLESTPPAFGERVIHAWKAYNGPKYLAIFLACVVLSIALVLFFGDYLREPRDALLAGFAWESLINKLVGHQQGIEDS
jgi:hypothetical protein